MGDLMQYETDEQAVARAIEDLTAGEAIDHATARTIASWFNQSDERALARVLAHVPDGQIVEPVTADILAGWSTESGGMVAAFVATGELPAPEHDEDENVADFQWAMRLGADDETFTKTGEARGAFQTYLVLRDRAEDWGPVPGWSDMQMTRHVDQPHKTGTLPECPACAAEKAGIAPLVAADRTTEK
jgi:hypothetical protein